MGKSNQRRIWIIAIAACILAAVPLLLQKREHHELPGTYNSVMGMLRLWSSGRLEFYIPLQRYRGKWRRIDDKTLEFTWTVGATGPHPPQIERATFGGNSISIKTVSWAFLRMSRESEMNTFHNVAL